MAGVDNETLEALVARLSAISNEKINQLEGNMDTFFVIVMSMIVFCKLLFRGLSLTHHSCFNRCLIQSIFVLVATHASW